MEIFGRLVRAVLIAPFAVVPAVFVSMPFASLMEAGFSSGLSVWVGMAFILSIFGTMYAWPIVLLIGLPVYGVLEWLRIGYAIPCAVAGGVIGLLFGTSMTGFPFEWLGFVAMVCGATVAAVFSRIMHGGWEAPGRANSAGETV